MKNHSISKYLFVILICALFVSCNQEELQKHNEAYFIGLIKKHIEENDKVLGWSFTRLNETGNKPIDVEVYQKMLTLRTERVKLLKEVVSTNFEIFNDTLITEYQSFISKICEEEDSFAVNKLIKQELIPIREFNQIKKTPSKFKNIIWVYHCVYLESVLLERYSWLIGSPSFSRKRRNNSFSDTKNISLGKTFEVIFVPEKSIYESPYITQIVYENVIFLIDSVETKIDYELEQIGFAGFLSFVPPKKGSYQIVGGDYFGTHSFFERRAGKCCWTNFSYELEVK